jgi:hypothetical protein
MTNTDTDTDTDTLAATLKDYVTEDALNIAIAYVTEDALNIAIAYLQKQLGVTEGDYASHFFDEETAEGIKTIFKDYIEGELELQAMN